MSGSKGSVRAALVCATLGLPLGWLAFEQAMEMSRKAVAHASLDDRQLILDASRAEALSLFELPAAFGVVMVVLLLLGPPRSGVMTTVLRDRDAVV